MFMPQEASLHSIYSYYLSTMHVNIEGDVNLSDDTGTKGLGTKHPYVLQHSKQRAGVRG